MLVLHGLTWLNRVDSGIMIGITTGKYCPVSSAPWLAMGIYTLENHRAMRFHGNAYQSVYSDCNVGNPTIDHTSLTLTFGAFANHNPEKRVHLVHYWVYHKNNWDFYETASDVFQRNAPRTFKLWPRKRISWFGTWSWTWKQWMICFEIRKKQVQSGLWRMCLYWCGTQESWMWGTMGINFSNLGEPLSPDIRSVRPDPTIVFFPRAPERRVLLKKKLRWYIFTSHICWSYIFTSYGSWSYIFRSFADLALPLCLSVSLCLCLSLSLPSLSSLLRQGGAGAITKMRQLRTKWGPIVKSWRKNAILSCTAAGSQA